MREAGAESIAIGDHLTFAASAIGCAGTEPHGSTAIARSESGGAVSFTLDWDKSCADPQCFAYRGFD